MPGTSRRGAGRRHIAVVLASSTVLALGAVAVGTVVGPQNARDHRLVGDSARATAVPPGTGAPESLLLGGDRGSRADRSAVDAAAVPGRQPDLVNAEDARLSLVASAASPARFAFSEYKRPYRVVSAGERTLVLTPRAEPYTVDDLLELSPEGFQDQGKGAYLLAEHVVVSEGASLELEQPGNRIGSEPFTLRLASGPEGFATVVSLGGDLAIGGVGLSLAKVVSWDVEAGAPDTDTSDGRAYVRAIGGSFTLYHADVRDLGFWSGRTGGIAFTGTERQDLGEVRRVEAGTGGVPEVQPDTVGSGAMNYVTGSVSDTRFSGGAYGLFVTASDGVSITGSLVQGSLIDGLLLHRSAARSTIEGTTSRNNGGHGLVIDRGVSRAVVNSVVSSGNALDGIVLDGQPLADGPSASGAPIYSYGGSLVRNSASLDNVGNGIEVVGGQDMVLSGNVVQRNDMGIVVRGTGSAVQVVNNRLAEQRGYGIVVHDGVTGAAVTKNVVVGGTTAVHVRDAVADLRNNDIEDANGHAVSFVGRVDRSSVVGNTLSGKGSTVVDTTRAVDEVMTRNNDASDWRPASRARAVLSWFLQPLSVLWTVILLMVGVSAVQAQRTRRVRGSHPYAQQLSGHGPAEAGPLTVVRSTGEPSTIDLRDLELDLMTSSPVGDVHR